ncbi:hypothetical protein [Kitasatospora sp. NPDC059160]|uniref:hypothetical protein n=1 Tax=Kitasatospora sp. NPDC059160 TaxID=3346748 RepID=UPI0036C480CC
MTPPPPTGPGTPDAPGTPGTPGTPDAPGTPGTPGTPDDPFAVLGEPVLAVPDRRRALLAVAGACGDGCGDDGDGRVGVFDVSGGPRRRLLIGTGLPVHAMAFRPARPLPAVGTGDYDGGYHFEGELLLVHLDSGEVRSLIGRDFGCGRQVLALEWSNDRDLRVLMAPADDEDGEEAHGEGHLAVVRRADRAGVGAQCLTARDLAGPRVPAPRPDHREAARRTVARLRAPRARRHRHAGGRSG